MGTAIVGAVAVLVGALASGVAQWAVHLAGRRERQREAAGLAVAVLLEKAARYRGEQYLKRVARRDHQLETPDDRRARYQARTEMTAAGAHVVRSVPDVHLRSLARELVGYSLAVGDCDPADLTVVGDQARAAHDLLQDAMAQYLHRA
ncbi:hypothetical protein [Streptomyces xanthochromogenes]|uniref:hypothetical protein n=1 Tax=Streptomyces xanthochromogenes TaxID=67384 RepID=UPI002F3E344B